MSGDLILGIDPGLSGALALVDAVSGELVALFDMPVFSLSSGHKIDEYKLARLVDEFGPRVIEAWVEQITPRPGQGVVGVKTSAVGYGLVRGVVVANFIPLHDVAPASWKRAMKVSGDKDEARQAATSYFPKSADRWPLKKHDGRAEAALIAAFGRRHFVREAA